MNILLQIPPIVNKAISKQEGTLEGGVATNPLASLIARLWQTAVILGSLALIIFLIWGAIDWLISEGNPDKLKNAQNKILHSLFGLGLLAATYAIVWFLKQVFGFDLLNIIWPTPPVGGS
jgi:hypothetical protein